jgi:hypothetical protein
LLAENSRASLPIVVPSNADISTLYAAEELSKYLRLITGADFEIQNNAPKSRNAIRVGFPYKGEKKLDEIRIFVKEGSLHITGEGKRGILYATYRLLENVGCGFWAPDNETIPNLKKLSVPFDIDIVNAPAFEVRQPHGASTYNHPEWKVKIGANGDMYCRTGSLAGKFGGHRQYDISQSAAGLYGYGKKADLLAKHPEWFAWRKKKNSRSGQQICMTNAGCREEVLRRVEEIMAKDPSRRQISVSIGDGFEFCQCESCEKIRKGEGESGLGVDLANYIARSVKDRYPSLRILTFAYEATKRPPKTMRLEPNVDVCFAFIQRDYSRSPSEFKPHDELLAKWTELSGGNVYVWGYNAQFKSYFTPYPIIDQMGDEMRTYKKFGVKGVFMQMSESALSDFIDMKCWLFSKLAWNPEQDEMALMRQWCDGACGKAAPYVYEWLAHMKKVRERVKADRRKGILLYAGDTRDYFTADDIVTGRELLSKALSAAEGDERAFRQVEKIAFSLDVVSLVRYNCDVAAAARKRDVKLPSREELYRSVRALSSRYKNGSWCEGMSFKEAMLRLRHGELWPDKKGDWMTTPSLWTFKNPVVAQSAPREPSIAYDEKTKSYVMVDTREEGLVMTVARRAVDLFAKGAEAKIVCKNSSSERFVNGELRCFEDGKWRIYATVETNGETHICVLESPKAFGQYKNRGRMIEDENAADPTLLKTSDGKIYLVYAVKGAERGIVVRRMKNFLKADSRSVEVVSGKEDKKLSSPAVVQRGGKTFIVYVSGDEGKSVMKALELNGSNPMTPASWKKLFFKDAWGKKTDVLMTSGNAVHKALSLYGPRSVNVFLPPGSNEQWFIYQGWSAPSPTDKAKGLMTLMQQFDFGDDGSLIRQAGPMFNIYLLQPGIKK